MIRTPPEKIFTREELFERYARPRQQKIVFTNGCFDILHRGHVEYLTYARSLGDVLIVGLNSDRSVTELKGPGRPINSEEDRSWIMGSLEAVDAVVVFEESTPLALIEGLLPDVLVKGGDYTAESVVGAPQVTAAGGKVVIADLVPGRSTTGLIARTRKGQESGV
jgi:D-beta-D-heptose 7-phosphate kinase / D-beta-D-heptose 1-phosphate adenosyltransferase